jgi:hypothetical protein
MLNVLKDRLENTIEANLGEDHFGSLNLMRWLFPFAGHLETQFAYSFISFSGAAVIGSAAGAAVIGSAFGFGGAGLIGYRMKRRVGVLEQFEFEPLVVDSSLHVGIAIAGWQW